MGKTSEKPKMTILGKKRSPRRAVAGHDLLERCRESFLSSFRSDPPKWILLFFLSLIISVFLFPSVLVRPVRYAVGDVASRDIKATRDFLVENREVTEKEREKAAREVHPIYDFDPSLSPGVLSEAFRLGREYISRNLDKAERAGAPITDESSSRMSLDAFKTEFFDTLKVQTDEKLLKILLKQGFTAGLEEAVYRLLVSVYEKGVVSNSAILKSQMERGGIILHDISIKKEAPFSDFNRFLDLDRAKGFIRGQLNALRDSSGSAEFAEAAVKLAMAQLQPNLTFNQRETEGRKEHARASVKPIYYKIKKGEMLVREGERILPEHLVKLSEEMKSQSWTDMLGRVPAMAVLIAALLAVIYLVGPSSIKSFSRSGKELSFSALCLLGFFLLIWGYGIVAEEIARGIPRLTSNSLLFALPLPCAAMIICVFQRVPVAIAFSLVISVLASFIAGGKTEFFVYFFSSCLVAAYGVKNCTERGVLIKTGMIVGLLNAVLALSLVMIFGFLHSWESVVAPIAGFAGGLISGVIATGIIPLIEMSFGFTTDIKLLELSSLDQPLLRQLMVQAPGTYHHCVITSNMVEATAKAVQANPLLSKVSAYYHDIGKMKKPLYFIENQMGLENRHDKLAPSMSSLILTSHVKDGVELAREYRLGKEIMDIIQQHHGTTMISFFYQKAKDRMAALKGSKSSEVKEEDFRYPGPKPQTKEAGLVMLADMVEAASRSLVEPTPSRIQGMVQKVINNVFSDGQLNECELTLKDLNEIAKSFNKTLSGIFHQRIEYPEAAKPSKKAKNGSTDQGGAEDAGARKQDDKGEVEEGLKRLGLS